MPAVIAALAFLAAHSQEGRKPDPPDGAAQKAAEKLIRDVFKEEYARKAPADRIALAAKLIDQARETRDDPASRYVLLREAQELAVQAGDPDVSFKAIEEMAGSFAVSAVDLKQGALAAIGKLARSPEECRRLASAHLLLAEEAAASGRPEAAEKSLETGAAWARKGKDLALVTKAEARLKEVKEARVRKDAVAAAEKVLASNPDDPAANAAVGQYRCLVLGDWKSGLPLLARGAESPLKAAALKELSAPSDPLAQVGAGDAWWDLSEKESGVARDSLRRRAAHWYGAALPKLAGLNRVKVERRMTEVLGAGAVEVDLLRMLDLSQDTVKGDWSMAEGVLRSPAAVGHAHLQAPYLPSEEYDLRLTVERKAAGGSLDIGLVLEQRGFLLVVDGYGEPASGLDTLDGRPANRNETSHRAPLLPVGKAVTIHCQIRKSGVKATVDGVPFLAWTGASSRLAMSPAYRPRDKRVLFLGTYMCDLAISRFSLSPVTGTGGKSR